MATSTAMSAPKEVGVAQYGCTEVSGPHTKETSSWEPTSQESPFARPPIDVLVAIFERALPFYSRARDIPKPSVRQAPLNISHVCRFWRGITLSSPQLWSTIFIREDVSYDLLVEFLNRSTVYPLDIYLSLTRKDSETIADELLDFIHDKLFRKERDRWRFVHIAIPMAFVPDSFENNYSGEDVGEASDQALTGQPGLQELTLRIPDGSNWSIGSVSSRIHPVIIDLFASPNLKRLDCSGVQICINQSGLTSYNQLRKLHLRLGEDTSLDTYLSLLANSRNLEDLRIKLPYDARLDHPWKFEFNLKNRISLTHLQYLYLNNSSEWSDSSITLMSILLAIEAPNLQRLRIHDCTRTMQTGEIAWLEKTLRELFNRSGHSLINVDLAANVSERSFVSYMDLLPIVEKLSVDMMECSATFFRVLKAAPDVTGPQGVRVPRLRELNIRCRNFDATSNDFLTFLRSRTLTIDDGVVDRIGETTCVALKKVFLDMPFCAWDIAQICERHEVKEMQRNGLDFVIGPQCRS